MRQDLGLLTFRLRDKLPPGAYVEATRIDSQKGLTLQVKWWDRERKAARTADFSEEGEYLGESV